MFCGGLFTYIYANGVDNSEANILRLTIVRSQFNDSGTRQETLLGYIYSFPYNFIQEVPGSAFIRAIIEMGYIFLVGRRASKRLNLSARSFVAAVMAPGLGLAAAELDIMMVNDSSDPL